MKNDLPLEAVPPWTEIVLAYGKEPLRNALLDLLRFDQRLARYVSNSKEPVLVQIRLEWWRAQFKEPPSISELNRGDPLLRSLALGWEDDLLALVALIDGWESLLAEHPIANGDMLEFVNGRAATFEALAKIAGCPEYGPEAAEHGRQWAYSDLARMGHVLPKTVHRRPPPLPKGLRPLALIGGLAHRSIKRGGRAPMFGDRLSPIVALRLGIFGV